MTETFKYDQLDRLDTVLFNNTVSECSAKLCLGTAERCELGEANGVYKNFCYLSGIIEDHPKHKTH